MSNTTGQVGEAAHHTNEEQAMSNENESVHGAMAELIVAEALEEISQAGKRAVARLAECLTKAVTECDEQVVLKITSLIDGMTTYWDPSYPDEHSGLVDCAREQTIPDLRAHDEGDEEVVEPVTTAATA